MAVMTTFRRCAVPVWAVVALLSLASWGWAGEGERPRIAALRRVDDNSTRELFADFYNRLSKGSSKLKAFTEARQALKKKYPQPYHWAPFVYIGDPR